MVLLATTIVVVNDFDSDDELELAAALVPFNHAVPWLEPSREVRLLLSGTVVVSVTLSGDGVSGEGVTGAGV